MWVSLRHQHLTIAQLSLHSCQHQIFAPHDRSLVLIKKRRPRKGHSGWIWNCQSSPKCSSDIKKKNTAHRQFEFLRWLCSHWEDIDLHTFKKLFQNLLTAHLRAENSNLFPVGRLKSSRKGYLCGSLPFSIWRWCGQKVYGRKWALCSIGERGGDWSKIHKDKKSFNTNIILVKAICWKYI